MTSPVAESLARQASGGIRAEIVHLREVRNAVNALPPEAERAMMDADAMTLQGIVITWFGVCLCVHDYDDATLLL